MNKTEYQSQLHKSYNMSNQAYLQNIKILTGMTPEDFNLQLEIEGFPLSKLKATDIVNWLNDNYELGQVHSMAIWAEFKSKGWLKDTKK